MRTAIALALLTVLAVSEVQAGAGEAGTAGGSSRASYGDQGGGGGAASWRSIFRSLLDKHNPRGSLNSNGQNPNGPGMQGSSITGQDTGK